jgi:epoxyqueuosine reductase
MQQALGSVWAELVSATGRHGVERLGVTTADAFPEVEAELERRTADGSRGGLGFTYTAPRIATNPRVGFPWARRLIVGGRPYLPGAGTPASGVPGTGRIARFAVGDAYEPLRAGLEAAGEVLRSHGFEAVVLCDDSRLVDRAAAVRAGVGWWGRNAMVLAPGAGPWMLLGSIVTDAPFGPTPRMERDCGTCTACLPACPTGALVAPGVLDARLCLAAWAQAPGVIPRELRPAMGDRIYGCDDCLEACPPGGRLLAASGEPRGSVDLGSLLQASDAELKKAFGHLYLPGRRPRVLRRNALVALANTGDERHHAMVLGYLGHPDWLLRLHAAWAAAILVGDGAGPFLEVALDREARSEVAAEISWAIGEVSRRPAGRRPARSTP